ncbi:hypothetical protein EON77_06340, partial [bacterium]
MKSGLLALALVLSAGVQAQNTTPPVPATPNAAAPQQRDPEPGPPLTLGDALEIASGNGYTLRLQNVTINRQLGLLRQTQAALGPTIGATAGYTRNGTQQFANFNGQQVALSQIDSRTLGLSFAIPIDLTGNLTRNIQAQRALYEAQRETFTATSNDLRRTVRTAYYGALRNQGLVAVSRATITNVQEQLRQAEAQFAEGLIARIDVERLRALLTQYQNELLINTNSLNLSKQSINFQLARPIETPFSLVAPEGNDIESVKDLKGKTVGVMTLGSASHLMMQASVADAGLKPDDVTYLPVSIGAPMAEALNSGTIDALAGWEGMWQSISALTDDELVPVESRMSSIPGLMAIVTTQKVLDENRDAVVAYVKNFYRSCAVDTANPTLAVENHWEVFPNIAPPAAERETLLKNQAEWNQPAYAACIKPNKAGDVGTLSEVEVLLQDVVVAQEGVGLHDLVLGQRAHVAGLVGLDA